VNHAKLRGVGGYRRDIGASRLVVGVGPLVHELCATLQEHDDGAGQEDHQENGPRARGPERSLPTLHEDSIRVRTARIQVKQYEPCLAPSAQPRVRERIKRLDATR